MAFDALIRDATVALDRELKDAFSGHLDRVVDGARGNHVFRNRTGTLESSITAGPVTGGVERGKLEGSVDATAPYASFVIDKTQDNFLVNAVNGSASQLEQDLVAAATRALEDAFSGSADGEVDGI